MRTLRASLFLLAAAPAVLSERITTEQQAASPGDILDATSDKEATDKLQSDFDVARDNALEFVLNKDLDLYDRKFKNYEARLKKWSWEEVNIWRFHMYYRVHAPSIVWKEDKISQQCVIEAAMADTPDELAETAPPPPTAKLYVETYCHAYDASDGDFNRCLEGLFQEKKPFIIKASHGANSNAIHPFCDVGDSDAYNLEAAKSAAASSVSSIVEPSEAWMIRMVKPGVIVQDCYVAEKDGEPVKDFGRPLELKILTLWGKVMGATLETRPKEFWVSREGLVWKWKEDQTSSGLFTRFSKKGKVDANRMDEATLDFIRDKLSEGWAFMREKAETIAQHFGYDELRVDFFIGGPQGPQINECTYTGGAARYPISFQKAIAQAYVEGYRTRGPCQQKDGSLSEQCKVLKVPDACDPYYHTNMPEEQEWPDVSEAPLAKMRYKLLRNVGINLGQGGR